jgi:hypothetical protein
LLFIFALEYTVKKVREKQERLELNGTQKIIVNTDDINVLGRNNEAIL